MGDSIRSAASLTCLLPAAGAAASIGIVFEPPVQTVAVGQTASVQVRLVGEDGPEAFSAAQVVFTWDPAVIALASLSQAGAVPLLLSAFPANDPTGFNETVPPQDGDGTYVAWAPLGTPTIATPRGSLVTTLQFTALAPGAVALVEPIPAGGQTKVVSGVIPGLVVTGALSGCTIEVLCSDVTADLDCDGLVTGADLGLLLSSWGALGGLADLDGSGIVDGGDLGLLLSAWSG